MATHLSGYGFLGAVVKKATSLSTELGGTVVPFHVATL